MLPLIIGKRSLLLLLLFFLDDNMTLDNTGHISLTESLFFFSLLLRRAISYIAKSATEECLLHHLSHSPLLHHLKEGVAVVEPNKYMYWSLSQERLGLSSARWLVGVVGGTTLMMSPTPDDVIRRQPNKQYSNNFPPRPWADLSSSK